MSDPLGKFLMGALSGYLFRRDTRAEKHRERAEREERKASERAAREERKEIERDIRRLRAEKRYLLMQRVYQSLQAGLTHEVKVIIGKLSAQVQLDQSAINELAAEVTKMIAKELGRED